MTQCSNFIWSKSIYSSQAWRVLVNRRITHWTIIELNALWLCELFEIERRRKRSLFCHLTVYFSFGLIFLFCNLNFERSCQFWESKVFFLWLAFALPHARLRAFSLPPFFPFLSQQIQFSNITTWIHSTESECVFCACSKRFAQPKIQSIDFFHIIHYVHIRSLPRSHRTSHFNLPQLLSFSQ